MIYLIHVYILCRIILYLEFVGEGIMKINIVKHQHVNLTIIEIDESGYLPRLIIQHVYQIKNCHIKVYPLLPRRD